MCKLAYRGRGIALLLLGLSAIGCSDAAIGGRENPNLNDASISNNVDGSSQATPDGPPGPDPHIGMACVVDMFSGVCVDTKVAGSCAEPTFAGACGAAEANIQCCLNDITEPDPNVGTPCTVEGSDGTCVDANKADSCAGTLSTGACPGPSNIQCCV